VRAGFRAEGRRLLLNRPVDYDRDKSEIHCYFDVLRAVAPDVQQNTALELWITDAERESAWEEISRAAGVRDFAAEKVLVGIQPGASHGVKRWPPECFAALSDAILDSRPDAQVVLIGGVDERETASAMLGACNAESLSRIIDFVGRFNLRGSLAAVSHLQLFVGNDTAVLHSAVALHVPAVALFGPTNPRKWGNYGKNNRVIESPDRRMETISVDVVLQAVQELLPARRDPTLKCGANGRAGAPNVRYADKNRPSGTSGSEAAR